MSLSPAPDTTVSPCRTRRCTARSAIAAAATGVLGAAIVLIATAHCGIGLSPDAVAYISAARAALEGKQLVSWDGSPFVDWPPLYPLLLAAFSFVTHQDPFIAARFLNALLFGAILGVSVLWMNRIGIHRILRVLAPASLVSVPLASVSTMAWSETAYILWSVLALIFLAEYTTVQRPRALYAAAVCAALACTTRYIGVTVILTAVAVLLTRPETELRARLGRSLLFVVLAGAPLALCLVRNEMASHTLMGVRAPAGYTTRAEINSAMGSVMSWFVPSETRAERRNGLMVVAVVIVAACLALMRSKSLRKVLCEELSGTSAPMWLHVLIYSAWLLATSRIYGFDKVDTRLLSPVFVPCTFAAAAVFGRWRSLAGEDRPAVRAIGVTAVIVFLTPFVQGARIVVAGPAGERTGAETFVPRDSPVGDWIRANAGAAAVYSNAPWSVYIASGRRALRSPQMFVTNGSLQRTRGELPRFKDAVARSRKSILVWYEHGETQAYSLWSIGMYVRMQMLFSAPDGQVYSVTEWPKTSWMPEHMYDPAAPVRQELASREEK